MRDARAVSFGILGLGRLVLVVVGLWLEVVDHVPVSPEMAAEIREMLSPEYDSCRIDYRLASCNGLRRHCGDAVPTISG
jgi:hypothetical protein